MRKLIPLIGTAILGAAVSMAIRAQGAGDITLAAPTVLPTVGHATIERVCLDFRTGSSAITYSYPANGTREELVRSVPFPSPMPAAIQTVTAGVRRAAARSLAGYPTGSLGAFSTPPIPNGTVSP